MGDTISLLQLEMILKNLTSLRTLNTVFLFCKLLRHRQNNCLIIHIGRSYLNYSDIFLICGYYISQVLIKLSLW